ncbi:hypothetical protein ABID65_007997 [Bradyrhizobium sp. S3.9.2]|uniref:hypothetical protein n=1 Tax=Bradyrhizobium sp. S3.9.2 TaxID=3156432 RepID=UPI003393150A
MLADPRQSRVVLLNLARGSTAGVAERFPVRCGGSLTLLPVCHEILGAKSIAVGEYLTDLLPVEVAASIEHLKSDALSPWRDPGFSAHFAEADVGIIFLGDGFLEEEVLIAALEGLNGVTKCDYSRISRLREGRRTASLSQIAWRTTASLPPQFAKPCSNGRWFSMIRR